MPILAVATTIVAPTRVVTDCCFTVGSALVVTTVIVGPTKAGVLQDISYSSGCDRLSVAGF